MSRKVVRYIRHFLVHLCGLGILFVVPPVQADPEMVTQRNNNKRTGAYLAETQLNPRRVHKGDFALLYTLSVQPQENHVGTRVSAQPLFVPNLTFLGVHRDAVLFVATNDNTLLAFDVGTKGLTPQKRLLKSVSFSDERGFGPQELPGMTRRFPGDSRTICLQTSGAVGVESTPVIDRANNAIYLIYRTASPFEAHKYDAKFYIARVTLDSLDQVGKSVEIASKENVETLSDLAAFDPNKAYIPHISGRISG